MEVVITPTYSGCPPWGRSRTTCVRRLEQAGIAARVVTQLAPAWTTDWMSDEAKEKLRAYGIARPTAPAAAWCAAAAPRSAC